MKKLLTVLLISFLVVSAFGLAACSDDKLPDFADCEVGYQLEVYPKVAFDYKISDDYIVHIDSITATLTAKNEISEGDVLDEAFSPYKVTIIVLGSVNEGLFEYMQNPNARLYIDLTGNGFGLRCVVNSDKTFQSEHIVNINKNEILYFNRART